MNNKQCSIFPISLISLMYCFENADISKYCNSISVETSYIMTNSSSKINQCIKSVASWIVVMKEVFF